MFKNFIIAILFAFFSFCIVELSYRVYAVGAVALNPMRYNTLVPLLHTNLVEKSEFPEVFYQLKPNLKTVYAGQPFSTNSHGLADKEYSLEKPADVYRVVVLGSSWTMATGVKQEESYHALMEARLKEKYPDKNIEFINFGVELYGLREIVGTVRHRVMEWQPDLILVSITSFTAYVEWNEPDGSEVLVDPKRNLFLEPIVLKVLDTRFKLGLLADIPNLRTTLSGVGVTDPYSKQVRRAFEELSVLSKEFKTPVAIMWLSYGEPGGGLDDLMQEAADELGVTYIKAYKVISGSAKVTRARQISRFDTHPNPVAHGQIAGWVINEFEREGLSPGVGQ